MKYDVREYKNRFIEKRNRSIYTEISNIIRIKKPKKDGIGRDGIGRDGVRDGIGRDGVRDGIGRDGIGREEEKKIGNIYPLIQNCLNLIL